MSEIEMTKVDSSLIEAVGYYAAGRILLVEFKKGGLYQYTDVPEEVFVEFRNAVSVGKYFLSQIKGKFQYLKR